MGVLEPSDAQIQRMLDRAAAWDHAVADRARLTLVNALALDFYAERVDRLGGTYLDDRLPGWRTSPTSPPTTPRRPGPPWRTTWEARRHRRRAPRARLATRARTGTLIDRFRDRAILPITHDHQILGFVARRHPGLNDDDRRGRSTSTPPKPSCSTNPVLAFLTAAIVLNTSFHQRR